MVHLETCLISELILRSVVMSEIGNEEPYQNGKKSG